MKKILILFLLSISQASFCSSQSEDRPTNHIESSCITNCCKPSAMLFTLSGLMAAGSIGLTSYAINEYSYNLYDRDDQGSINDWDSCSTQNMQGSKRVTGACGLFLMAAASVTCCKAIQVLGQEQKEAQRLAQEHQAQRLDSLSNPLLDQPYLHEDSNQNNSSRDDLV
ncbi:hypothetical protein [Candidatus Chromulinivorax destructor]|uniref:Uncharacterized protein n=1 Tax=Candidatus Chromulinivorax destructor TaxID=2066483 RepID=A0A345ZAW0_9BACT|nr:hypothetical protein [Candidatus Chromulinivorax destructor]AXK60427.1 hypothetical protein C0J27_01540 [Candidatus Chromulinivorax destructor]